MNADLRQRGAAAIEFVFWLPIMVLLTGGVMDFSWYMSRSYHIARTVRDAARIGAATPEPPGTDFGDLIIPASENHVQVVMTTLGIPCGGDCEVDVEVHDTSFQWVHVRVSVPYDAIFGSLIPVPDRITYEFTMALEKQ